MTPTELPFDEIWLHDFEFVSQPGERPDVVCLAAHELRSGRTLRLWRDELGTAAAVPYRPRCAVRQLRRQRRMRLPPGARLAAAGARARSKPSVSQSDQRPLRRRKAKACSARCATTGSTPSARSKRTRCRSASCRAGRSRRKSASGFCTYCYSDVDALQRLLPSILAEPEFDLGVALYHGEFAAVSALMEHRGVPIDMEVFRAARRQGHLARGARRHGAGDRRPIWRLCPQRRRRLDLQHGTLRRLSRARRHRAGRCSRPASSTCSARPSRT